MGTIYENEAPVERVILVAISERDGDDTVASLEELAELGHNRLNVTIGSALDLFGGTMSYEQVIQYIKERE